MLPDVIKNDVEVDNQIKVSNLLEPELSELVRLFYWINVCRRIIDKESFELKFNEFRAYPKIILLYTIIQQAKQTSAR